MTSKDMFKSITYESLEKQVGGNHYSKMKIQPAQFINENNLEFAEGNAIKYIIASMIISIVSLTHIVPLFFSLLTTFILYTNNYTSI